MEYLLVVIVIALLWACCGWFAYGLTLADFQRTFLEIAESNFYGHRRIALLMGAAGPFGLITSIIGSRAGKYGFLWQWRKPKAKNPERPQEPTPPTPPGRYLQAGVDAEGRPVLLRDGAEEERGQVVLPEVPAGFDADRALMDIYSGRIPGRSSEEDTARAYSLLVQEVGTVAAERLKAGGAYAIHSKLWPSVVYIVPRSGSVKVLKDGAIVGTYCVVPKITNLPWPDQVITRIKAIQDDELVIFTQGDEQEPLNAALLGLMGQAAGQQMAAQQTPLGLALGGYPYPWRQA